MAHGPPRVSPDRILAAAALEFAERGFAGARVDRIARRARVNKAMLYYHFKSKQALYRTLLRRMFTRAGDRLAADRRQRPARPPTRSTARSPARRRSSREHALFPAIMLREVAEGGAHLDRETLAALAAVPRAVAARSCRRASPQGASGRCIRSSRTSRMFAPIVVLPRRRADPQRDRATCTLIDLRRAVARRVRRARAGRDAPSLALRRPTPRITSSRGHPTMKLPQPQSESPDDAASSWSALALRRRDALQGKPPADRVRASPARSKPPTCRSRRQVGGRLLELSVAEGDRVAAGAI